ncbi:hypothetical protein GYB43_14725 [bacterium]|nr:hypothetical protein [bacterium]
MKMKITKLNYLGAVVSLLMLIIGASGQEVPEISADPVAALVYQNEEIPDFPNKKLTPQQARESLTRGLGKFQGKGTMGPVGGEQTATRDSWQARMVDGEIAAEIVGRFEDKNQKTLYRSKIHYDEQLGLFVMQYAATDGSERTTHVYSDPITGRDYHRAVAPSMPPGVSVRYIRNQGKDGHGKGKMQVTENGKPVFRAKFAFQKIGPVDDEEFEKTLAEYEQSMKVLKSNKLTFFPYTTREALPRSRGDKEVWIVFQNDLKKAVKYWYVEGEENELYGEMQSGERRPQQTFAGHVWLITDKDDKPLGYFVVGGVKAMAHIGPVKPARNPN